MWIWWLSNCGFNPSHQKRRRRRNLHTQRTARTPHAQKKDHLGTCEVAICKPGRETRPVDNLILDF